MPSFIQSSFSTGEMAPEFYGRTDLGLVYQHGLRHARNFHVLPQGSATFRPGTRFVANAKNGAAQPVRMVKMVPSDNQVYVLEFGPSYIRFYRNRAPVLTGGVPYEVPTTYAAGELASLSFTHHQNQLWIWHRNHAPALLTWTDDTHWALANASFKDGPYLDVPPLGAATLTPGTAGTDTATLTASSLVGINDGGGFVAGDVGRLIRVRQNPLGLASFGTITAGTGYHVGDLLTVDSPGGLVVVGIGGAFQNAQIAVTAVNGSGGVTEAQIADPGLYMIAPTPFAIGSNTGSGTGFSCTPTYSPQPQNELWSPGVIQSVSSTSVISVKLETADMAADGTQEDIVWVATSALSTWRLGAWGGQEGYPAIGGSTFQGRLLCGGTVNYPKRLFASATGGGTLSAMLMSKIVDMAPTLASGQVVDNNAIVYDLDDEQGDLIRWISPAGNAETPQIGVGTGNAEHVVQPGNLKTALSATGVQSYKVSEYTSAPIAPIRIGRFLLFVERGAKRLREWMYYWMAGGFVGPEASPYGRHLLLDGVSQMAYALTPHPTIWIATKTGDLNGLSYMPEQSVATTPKENISAWHSHKLGGRYYGSNPYVESLVVVPDEDGGDDQLWLSVIRADGAGLTKTIEVSTPYFRSMPLDQAVFLDCAISSALTFPSATCTPVLQVFGPSGNFLPDRGDAVSFGFSADVAAAGDLAPGTVLRINNGTFLLTAVTDARTVATLCIDTPNSLAPAAADAWSYTKMATSFSGFDIFDGRTVGILADGQVMPHQTVSGGAIALPVPASYITVGYPYTGILHTLDLDIPAADGTSQMKEGRFDHLYLRIFQTLGGSYGSPARALDDIPQRQVSDIPGWAPALVSDDIRLVFPGGASSDHRVIVQQTDPLPMTLSALVVKGSTTEQEPLRPGGG